MTFSRSLLVAAALVASSMALGLWAYQALPAGAFLPYHHWIGGPADGRLPKAYALALMPTIAALVVACLAAARRRAADPAALERSIRTYGLLVTGLAGVLLVAQAGFVWRMTSGDDAHVVRLAFLAVAVLLLVLGNDLGKVRHNTAFGLRTPWTLGDARVWDKTHRVAGRLMVLGGLGLVAACLLLADLRVLVPVMVVLTAGPLLYAIGYSRRAYARERRA
jgi:uncharacterized membrane protein